MTADIFSPCRRVLRSSKIQRLYLGSLKQQPDVSLRELILMRALEAIMGKTSPLVVSIETFALGIVCLSYYGADCVESP